MNLRSVDLGAELKWKVIGVRVMEGSLPVLKLHLLQTLNLMCQLGKWCYLSRSHSKQLNFVDNNCVQLNFRTNNTFIVVLECDRYCKHCIIKRI